MTTSALPESTTSHHAALRLTGIAALLLLGMTGLALFLAWVSTSFANIEGWGAFLAVEVLCLGLAAGAWLALRAERLPRKLAWLALLAFGLRLLAGGLWLTLLPNLGHGTPAERAGYVMADAAARDQAAWRLATSDRPLWTAFEGNRKVDQYGGMLFLSALVYRQLGASFPQPLLIVVITATVSAVALLITWGFAKRVWDVPTAWLAAWILCLYPEAVLLGSSQMREAFMLALVSAAFYGLARTIPALNEPADRPTGGGPLTRLQAGPLWILGALALLLPLSPPFAALLVGMLGLTALFSSNLLGGAGRLRSQRWLWILLAALAVLALAGLWLTLKQFTPARMWNPFEMLGWWLRKSAQYQAYLSEHASGWMQKLFDNTPEWIHLPMLMAYGIVQPFLPAALGADSHATIWQWIAVWRAVGWTLMLALLIYAPLLAWRKRASNTLPTQRHFTQALLAVVWLVILIAAFRGGSDQWDNPRYRAAFAGLQAALAAWAWEEHHRVRDPWLRRAFLCAAAILAWFIPWYMRRYAGLDWPASDPLQTLGLGLASAALLCTWDIARTAGRASRDVPPAVSQPSELDRKNRPETLLHISAPSEAAGSAPTARENSG